MDFSTLQAETRSRLIEDSAAYFSDAEIKRWLNIGYKDFIKRAQWAEKITAAPLVANQYEYALASDAQYIKAVRFQDQYRVQPYQYEDFLRLVGTGRTATSERPTHYTVYPWDKRLRVWPVPSEASPSTTMNDAGGVSSSDTSIILTAVTDFPASGYIKIENELILYYKISGTTLQQCVRGAGRTTAATHADATAVNVAELQIYHTYMPVDLSASGDTPEIPEEYHESLVVYAVNIGLTKRQKFNESNRMYEKYLEMVNQAQQQRNRESLDSDYVNIRDADTLEYS